MDAASIDAVVTTAASRTTTAGAATGVLGFLASSTFVGLAGLIIAITGLLVNLHFQRRRDRREQEEHAARMIEIRAGKEALDDSR